MQRPHFLEPLGIFCGTKLKVKAINFSSAGKKSISKTGRILALPHRQAVFLA
jgi:hypothetical protein